MVIVVMVAVANSRRRLFRFFSFRSIIKYYYATDPAERFIHNAVRKHAAPTDGSDLTCPRWPTLYAARIIIHKSYVYVIQYIGMVMERNILTIFDSASKYPVIRYSSIVFIYIFFNKENTDRWDDVENNVYLYSNRSRLKCIFRRLSETKLKKLNAFSYG